MNEPPGARARVALTGLTVAEYFRDQEGQDVLLFIDNIFRFTQAGSEVSIHTFPLQQVHVHIYMNDVLTRKPWEMYVDRKHVRHFTIDKMMIQKQNETIPKTLPSFVLGQAL